MKRFHLPALGALAAQIAALAASPLVLNFLPAKWSAVVVATLALVQAVTEAVHKPASQEAPTT